ncbi:hypothetical protein EE612_040451, partial [Oryza sativa]
CTHSVQKNYSRRPTI